MWMIEWIEKAVLGLLISWFVYEITREKNGLKFAKFVGRGTRKLDLILKEC